MDGIIENRELESLVVPEGVVEIGHQAFCGDWEMTLLDLPSSVMELYCDAIMEDKKLSTLILRSPQVVMVVATGTTWPEYVPWSICHLVVPRHLISEYRKHPYWGRFKHIDQPD